MVKSATRPSAPTRAVAAAGSSAIRDLLELTERPHVLSLAGGLPHTGSFPVAALTEAAAAVLADDPTAALQYGPTEGHRPLRELLAARRSTTTERVLVTTGSQQAIDLAARALVERGATIALGDPAYVGALQAFRAAGASLAPIGTDRDGLRVDELADRLRAGLRPALVYVVANLDNPTGATLPADRRIDLAGLADRYGFWILDDDPYGELRWADPTPLPLCELTDRTITLGSASKVLTPGLRVGWAVAAPEAHRAMTILKQAGDLHTSSLSQLVVHRLLADGPAMAAHLDALRATYRAHADALVGALGDRLGDRLAYRRPDGGMFLWASLAEGVAPGLDASALLHRALDHGVAFVPGAAFSVAPGGHARALRLSFATVAPDRLPEAVDRLAAALR